MRAAALANSARSFDRDAGAAALPKGEPIHYVW